MSQGKNSLVAIVIISATLFLSQCAHRLDEVAQLKKTKELLDQIKSNQSLVQSIDPLLFYKVQDTVYEVLIKKRDNHSVILDREIPDSLFTKTFGDDSFYSVGTAFSVEEGYFLSAAHVFRMLSSPEQMQYYIRNIRGDIYPVENITKFDNEKDVIEFTVQHYTPRDLLHLRDQVSLGELVYTAGNALGHGISIRGGVVASFSPDDENEGKWENIRYTAPASPGNSGGPLLDDLGQVVGIVLAKSPDEDLNYALPVNELKKIPRHQGILRLKGAYVANGLKTTDDTRETIELGKSLNEISQVIFHKHNDFYKSLQKKHSEDFKTKLFPYHRNVASFLGYQQVSKHWSKVNKNSAGVWSNELMSFEEVDLGNQELVEVSVPEDFKQTLKESLIFKMGIIYKKNPNEKLNSILKNPLPTINKIARAAKLQVHLAGEFLLVDELEKADHEFSFRDQLGRYWEGSVWRNSLPEVTIFSLCSPNPGGLFCQTGFLPTLFEVYAFEERMKDDVNSWLISYNGTATEWEEFFKLDAKYLPSTFQNARVESIKDQFELKFNELSFHWKWQDQEKDNTNIVAYTRFGLDDPFRMSVTGYGLSSEAWERNFYALTFIKPKDSFNSEALSAWNQSKNEEGSYNGQLFYKNNKKNLRLVDRYSSLGRVPASEQSEPQYLLRFFCEANSSTADELLESDCQRFREAIQFHSSSSDK